MQETVLEIKNVSKYFGKTRVLEDINLVVKSKEIYGFLGPNGAGKTTTIKMILGLLSIDKGEIKIASHDISKDFEKAMECIGGIVENPDLYDYMSGLNNLKLYARVRDVDNDRVNEVVELVGLTDRIRDKVGKYSLGMKQRLGLALTLLHKPKVLILDEPTNGLDPAGIRLLRDILKKLAHEENIAIFISSHMLSEMQLMCDKVAVIDKGKIIKLEDIKNVINETDDEENLVYIIKVNDKPKAVKLLKAKFGEESVIEKEDEEISLNLSKKDVKEIAKIIIQNDIELYELAKHNHSLEDAFLNMTNGGGI